MKKTLAQLIQAITIIFIVAALAGCPTGITQAGDQNNTNSGTDQNVPPPPQHQSLNPTVQGYLVCMT